MGNSPRVLPSGKPGAVHIAVAGGVATLSVAGRNVPTLTGAIAKNGETVLVGPMSDDVYAFLAVAGGFDVWPELGSLSVNRLCQAWQTSQSGWGCAAHLWPRTYHTHNALTTGGGCLPAPIRLWCVSHKRLAELVISSYLSMGTCRAPIFLAPT